jgi:hypothetical protein
MASAEQQELLMGLRSRLFFARTFSLVMVEPESILWRRHHRIATWSSGKRSIDGGMRADNYRLWRGEGRWPSLRADCS